MFVFYEKYFMFKKNMFLFNEIYTYSIKKHFISSEKYLIPKYISIQ